MLWRTSTYAAVCLAFGWLGWQVSDRSVPVVVAAAKAEAPAPAGGLLRISYRLQRNRQCETVVDRAIFDAAGTRFILPPLEFLTGAGPVGEEVYFVNLPVPPEAVPGPAIYRTTSRFVCNLTNRLWPITGEPREVQFVVSGGRTSAASPFVADSCSVRVRAHCRRPSGARLGLNDKPTE